MAPEQIYRALQRSPFQPVRVFLKDGRRFEIAHRNQVIVGVTYVDIGMQAPDMPLGICHGFVTCAPDDVVRVDLVNGDLVNEA